MSIETAERLKKEWTDKYVAVAEGVPELRRFVGLNGLVKTINMNCRALVEFDSGEDISWYDIDPSYLTVIDAPVKKKAAAAKPQAKSAAAKPAGKKPAGKSPLEMARAQGAAGTGQKAAPAKKEAGKKSSMSPLEMARQQGAAKSAKSAGSAPAAAKTEAKPKTEGKKLSPLELARQQGAVKSAGDVGSAAEAPAAPSKKAAPVSGKKLSPLELARQQGAFKEGDAVEESVAPVAAAVESGTAGEESAAAPKAEKPTTGADGKPLSIIERARLEGPFKG